MTTVSEQDLPTYDDLALQLEEATDQLELAAEDKDWRLAGLAFEREFSRQGLTAITRNCQLMVIASPLIKRGVQLRTSYVWGQGVSIQASAGKGQGEQDVNAVVQAFLDDEANQRTFTGAEARIQAEHTVASKGNYFLAFATDPVTGRVQVITVPFEEVIDKYTDPDNRERDWFFLREYTETVVEAGTLPNTLRRRRQTRRVFHPALNYRPPASARPKVIDNIPVDWDTPLLHVTVNRPEGWKWGVPDVYASLPWARAYEGFLTDWARLVKALSKFAWRLTGDRASKVQKAATKAAAAVRRVAIDPLQDSDAGQMAAMGPGVNLEAIPKSGATIDSESGRPLAAMVAAGMGLSVVSLLADPGTTGARAVAETLDKPQVLEMGMRQEMWASVIKTVTGYVIARSIEAPRGVLKGEVTRDDEGRETVTLRGDQATTVEVAFPALDDLDPKAWVDAIVAADSTEVLPPVWVVKALLRVLGEDDVDEVIAEMLDDEGNFVDPRIAAAAAAIANQRTQRPTPPPAPEPAPADDDLPEAA